MILGSSAKWFASLGEMDITYRGIDVYHSSIFTSTPFYLDFLAFQSNRRIGVAAGGRSGVSVSLGQV